MATRSSRSSSIRPVATSLPFVDQIDDKEILTILKTIRRRSFAVPKNAKPPRSHHPNDSSSNKGSSHNNNNNNNNNDDDLISSSSRNNGDFLSPVFYSMDGHAIHPYRVEINTENNIAQKSTFTAAGTTGSNMASGLDFNASLQLEDFDLIAYYSEERQESTSVSGTNRDTNTHPPAPPASRGDERFRFVVARQGLVQPPGVAATCATTSW
jgi:hypothetical protein